MDESLARRVRQRAGGRCEYCRLPERVCFFSFEIDHVIPRRHGGATTLENLALACYYCNNAKGVNLGGIDPDSGKVVRLFNPRRDNWKRHFRWDAARLVGRTQTARATIAVLEINSPEAVELREALLDEGLFPAE